MKRAIVGVLLLALAGCGGSDGGPGDGDEGGACFGNGTCSAGLECRSDTCVDIGGVAGVGGDGDGDGDGDSPRGDAANGDLCSVDADCSSNVCGTQTDSGEGRCYGNKRSGEVCGDTYDCAGGACIPDSLFGGDACSEAIVAAECQALPSACRTYAAAGCAFLLDCGASFTFDECVASDCLAGGAVDLAPSECADITDAILNGLVDCP